MIDSNKIVNSAIRRLSLNSVDGFEPFDAYTALEEALVRMQDDCPAMFKTGSVTTVADQSEYALPEDMGFVMRVVFPEEWAGREIEQLTPVQLEAVRNTIKAGDDDLYSDQPSYWAVIHNATAPVIAFEDASTIEAGLAVSFVYAPQAYAPRKEKESVDVPVRYVNALKDAVTEKLAAIYRPDRLAYWSLTADRSWHEIKFAMITTSAHPMTADVRPF